MQKALYVDGGSGSLTELNGLLSAGWKVVFTCQQMVSAGGGGHTSFIQREAGKILVILEKGE